jgi:putative transposase
MRAWAAVKERRTVHEWAADSGVHPPPLSQWKRQWLEGMSARFASRRQKRAHEGEVLQAERYQEIGRLKLELEWLKEPVAPCTPGHPRDAGVGASRAQREASRCVAGGEPRQLS